MTHSDLRRFVIRHRITIRDTAILIAFMLVALFVAFEVEIFEHEGSATLAEERVELNESLLLGGLFAIGLLVFATRRYLEQKTETLRRIAAERHARELAFQDALTGLPNRRQFDDALQAALDAPPRAGASHGVFLLDLNGFKQINDVHGHGVGDDVLIAVSQRLRSAMRDGDMVARFGGDEFAILSMHLSGPEVATSVARRVIEVLEAPIDAGRVVHHVGVGIGIALIPGDASTTDETLRKADVALYRAKAERRSALRFFEMGMDHHIHERERMERELRTAIADDAIRMVYRPTFDLRTNEVIGFEATPRWVHATEGEVAPSRFLAIAEDAGLIHDLADTLMRQACESAAAWPTDVRLAIDVLPVQLENELLSARILNILAETGLAPRRLEVEITESALVANLGAAQFILGALREAGVRIVLDNFGTGYSSLYHLRNFKLDKIKIDRSFIDAMCSEEESATIVNALVGMGQGLGLTIAAEGVDSTTQRSSLVDTGCVEGQGRLMGDRLSADAALALFAAPRHRRTA